MRHRKQEPEATAFRMSWYGTWHTPPQLRGGMPARRDNYATRHSLLRGGCRGSVLRLILKRGLQQLAVGTVLGLLGAWTVGRVMEKLLVETSAADPAVHGTSSFVLCSIALAACVIPAWKAARLDPLSALRSRN
jgi:hypothetical protein